MASTIRIRRSAGSSAPGSLAQAEMAYVEQAGAASAGVLYIGLTGGAIQPIGGLGYFAPLVSPALTGSPTAPTASTGDNSTLIATTAFVKAQSYLVGTGVSAATYTKVTVNGSGLVTAGTTLVAADIPTLTASKISDFDTQVRTSRLDQMAPPTGSVSMNNQLLVNLADPVSAQDGANKRWVEALFSGLENQASVLVSTSANVTLSGGAPDDLDDVALSTGKLVLVQFQTDPIQNGVYKVSTLGTGSNGTWVRATDEEALAVLDSSGLFVFVQEGTQRGGNGYTLATPNPIDIGVTALTFIQTSGGNQVIAGPGIGKDGNEVYVKLGTAGTPAGYSYTTGGMVWCNSSSTLTATGALTGILKGNGTGAPTAVTGTADTVVKWGSAGQTIGNSTISDDGTTVAITVATPILRLSSTTSNAAGTIQFYDVVSAGVSGGVQASNNAGNDLIRMFRGAAIAVDEVAILTDSIRFTFGSTERWRITSTGALQSPVAQTVQTSSGTLTIQPAGNTVFATTSGAVGIGTASPSAVLTILGSSTTTLNAFSVRNSDTTAGAEVTAQWLVFNGTGGLIIRQSTNATGPAWAVGSYDAYIHTGQSSSQLHLAGGNGASKHLTINSTGSVMIGTTTAHSKMAVVTNALGTTQTATSGIAIVNETAAGAGAQQISPALRLRGYGWKTDSTAASRPVDFRVHVVPVEGAANPTGYLSVQVAINDGAYSEIVRIGSTQLAASAVVLTDANRQLTTTTTLGVANGGTGLAAYTVGDLVYASGTTTLSALADVATGNALISGGVGVAPSWGKIGLTTHVSGTLAVGNGGTGITAVGTANQILGTNNGATAFEHKSVLGTANQITVTHGAGSITLSTPQNIHTGASPTFAGATLSGLTQTHVLYAGSGGVVSGDAGMVWDATNKRFDITKTALGTTQSDASGLLIQNTTAAALDAQQISPALRFRGYGRKTDATAASQSVDFRIHVVPVQGAAAATGYLTVQRSIDGAAYGEVFRLDSSGVITVATWQGAAISPLYGGTGVAAVATGDVLYGSGVNTWGRRTAGAEGQLFKMVSGVPNWSDEIDGGTF